MKYIQFINKSRTVSCVISVKDEDFDLAWERCNALQKRWNENPIEMVNNHNPIIYTRMCYLETLIDEYVSKGYLIPGKDIEIIYPEYQEFIGNSLFPVTLKYLKEAHLD